MNKRTVGLVAGAVALVVVWFGFAWVTDTIFAQDATLRTPEQNALAAASEVVGWVRFASLLLILQISLLIVKK